MFDLGPRLRFEVLDFALGLVEQAALIQFGISAAWFPTDRVCDHRQPSGNTVRSASANRSRARPDPSRRGTVRGVFAYAYRSIRSRKISSGSWSARVRW